MMLKSFFCSLFGLATLSQSVLALTVPSLNNGAESLQKRAGSLAIKGVPGDTHPRLEIRQMQANYPNQFTLYLLAMQKFQAMPQTELKSYYQVAGIHGVPRSTWDSVEQCSTCTNTDGYCTHDSILFPGWHRAYLTLFEQLLIETVKSVAASYTGTKKTTMQNAAKTMRLPYWDWAAHPGSGRPTLPSAITASTVTVDAPGGKKKINNPLFRHEFANPSNMHYSPFINWKVRWYILDPESKADYRNLQYTLRYPNSNAASASSQESKAIAAFNNIRASMQDQVYAMLTNCNKFVEVGHDAAAQSSASCANSLEQIHNTIHTTAGGPTDSQFSAGHISYLATAAFDPIFFLHHANVDRLFAMWQTIHPTSWSGSQVAPANTWTIAKGSTQNLNSPLTPFHKNTNGEFLTTNDMRSWRNFHYTYPEFRDSDGSKAAIASYVNKLYGPSATATAGSSKRTAIPDTAVNIARATSTSDPTPLTANNGSLFQYVANIKTPRYALNGSYSIYLFNGSPTTEDDPTSWIFDQNLIGPMGVIAQPGMTVDVVTTGSIPLTRTLTDQVQNGLLSTLTEALVVPWLIANLEWRILGPQGQSVDPDTIPDFEVTVFASTATQPTEFALPEWSKFIPLAEVTQNKPGGATKGSILQAMAAGTIDR